MSKSDCRHGWKQNVVDQLERQERTKTGDKSLGDWAFEIGLWVGSAATPNRMGGPGDTGPSADSTAYRRLRKFKSDSNRHPSPVPLENCPWCGTKFNAYSFRLVPSEKAPQDLRITCVNANCAFTGDQPLPVLAVDESIYRRLPCFLIATVDKFAALPWIGPSGKLFGLVERFDNNGFYNSAELGRGHALGGPLPPPGLIIQDELHLISGPLGTIAGVYETTIGHLAERDLGNGQISAVAVACIDRAWIYPGGNNYQGLLAETDLTEETFARTTEVKAWISEAQAVAAQKVQPEIAVGDHCRTPFECGFCNYCNQGLPKPTYPIDWLPRFPGGKRATLAEEGVDDLRGVDDKLLNEIQLRVKQHTLNNTVFFDAVGAAADLAPHGLPAYFLDFESIQFAVPIWKGTRPYQQIPFQFSLHSLGGSGHLAHRAFLDLSGEDPSDSFARTLIDAVGDHGPIFVYNAAFECTRIRELADRFPVLSPPLLAIVDRVVDLLPVARKRYYHPSQKGSWSIKAVLPAAVPELSYDKLIGVKDGGAALQGYAEAIAPNIDLKRKDEIKSQLLAYCRLDTFAMVRLWQTFNGRNESALLDM